MPAVLESAGPEMKFEVLMKCLNKYSEVYEPNKTYILTMLRDYLIDCGSQVEFLHDCLWPACMNEIVNVIVQLAR